MADGYHVAGASPRRFLTQFRPEGRPAVDTHPRCSAIILAVCAVLVIALCGAGIVTLRSHGRDYARAAWLLSLKGRAALLTRDRAAVSGGWEFDRSAIRPCAAPDADRTSSARAADKAAADNTVAADAVAADTADVTARTPASRRRLAARRTCRETITSPQARAWLADRQHRLLSGGTGAGAGFDARVVDRPVTLSASRAASGMSGTSAGRAGERMLRGDLVTAASPRLAAARQGADGRRPLVVCASGLGVTMGYCRWLVAQTLAPLGWPTLVFDPSGIATHSASDGPMEQMSVISEERDLERMVRYARTLPWVDPGRLVLVGQSQGGLASLLLAGRHPGWASRIVLDYPALNIPALVRFVFPSRDFVPEKVGILGFWLGRRYATDVWDLDAWSLAARVRVPVLIEQGEEDAVVDPSVSYRAAGTLPRADLVLLPHERHNFGDDGRLVSAVRIVEFLSR